MKSFRFSGFQLGAVRAFAFIARAWRYAAFALLIYLAFLLITMPAARAYALLKERIAPLQLYELEGTAWSGKAALAVAGARQFQAVSWHVHPWALLLGHTEVALDFDEAGRHTQAVAGRTLGGGIYLRDIETRLPATALENMLNISGTGLDGTLNIALAEVAFADKKLSTVNGTLTWSNAGLMSPKTALGNFVMTLETSGQEIKGVLKDSPGSPLRAEGLLRLKPDGAYQFTGNLSLRDPGRPDLEQALRFFGSPGPGGKVAISTQGMMPLPL
ncbi:MAG: type II secretion system protein N [Gammaproteobacteria bacterium]